MSSIVPKVDSTTRGPAKKILTFCGEDSRRVRVMKLDELTNTLQRCVNDGLVTKLQIERAFREQSKIDNDAQKDKVDVDDNGNGDDTDTQSGDTDGDNTDGDDWDKDESEDNEQDGDDEGDDTDEQGGEQETDEDRARDDDATDEENAERVEAYKHGRRDRQDEQERNPEQYPQEHQQEAYNQGYDFQETENEKRNEEDNKQDEDQQQDEQQDDGEGDDESQDEQDDDDMEHSVLKRVLKYIRAGLNVALVGPAGTGKSYISRQVAEILERDFYVNGAMMSKYDLIGYNDAHGTYHETPAYQAFKNGGVHCFDELDASAPDAVVAFNGMTDDQPFYTFPCGQIEQHPDYVAIACMNTWGKGATADYVGRYKQDEASMTRFVKLYVGYDDTIEAKIAGEHKDILNRVRALRAACEELGIRHIVSTRMIVQAVAARTKGKATRKELDTDIFFAGLDDSAITQLKPRVSALLKEYKSNA